ncbi:hypothetical protein ACMFMG_006189 [Clarireedia jacksonii]
MNVDLKQGIHSTALPAGTQSLNSFMWIVNTSDPSARVRAQMLVPFNRNMLVALRPAGPSPSAMLTVAKRALNASSGQFMPLQRDMQFVRELPDDRIQLPVMTQLDGQYIILVTNPETVNSSECRPKLT